MNKYSISFKNFNICEVGIAVKESLEMEYSELINRMRLKSQITIESIVDAEPLDGKVSCTGSRQGI